MINALKCAAPFSPSIAIYIYKDCVWCSVRKWTWPNSQLSALSHTYSTHILACLILWKVHINSQTVMPSRASIGFFSSFFSSIFMPCVCVCLCRWHRNSASIKCAIIIHNNNNKRKKAVGWARKRDARQNKSRASRGDGLTEIFLINSASCRIIWLGRRWRWRRQRRLRHRDRRARSTRFRYPSKWMCVRIKWQTPL